MEKAARATLRYLFREYLRGPSVPYTINAVTTSHNANAIELSDYLVERNWIRERWVYGNGLVSCRISIAGIEEIDPVFVRLKLRNILGALVDSGGSKGLMEIFQHKIDEYPIALDIVQQLEKLGLVKMIHRFGNIEVELTESGWQFLEKKGKSMFSLMMAVA